MYMHKEKNMHRTTIMLPDDLKTKAEEVSRKKGLSLGEFVREAVRDQVEKAEEDTGDSFFCDTAVYRGPAPIDLSGNHDEHLYGGKR
jgi:predicted DNA-binding protein